MFKGDILPVHRTDDSSITELIGGFKIAYNKFINTMIRKFTFTQSR